MSSPRASLDNFASALGHWVIRWRYLVALGCILAALAAASGARFLSFSTDYRVFFDDDNPRVQSYEALQRVYTKTDSVQFVIKPAQGEIVQERILEAVIALTERAWQIPYTTRVDSLSNYQYTSADGDDLTVEDLVRNGADLPQEELDRRKGIALAEPLLNGNLISPDGDTVGVNVTLQYPGKSLTEVPEAVGYARQLAEGLRRDFPDLQIALAGISMLNNSFAESGQSDVARSEERRVGKECRSRWSPYH